MQRTGSSHRTTSLRGTPLKRLALGFGIGGVLVLVTLAGKFYLNAPKSVPASGAAPIAAAPAPKLEAADPRLPSLMDGLDGALEPESVTSDSPAKALTGTRRLESPLSSEDATSPMELAITLMVTIAGIVGVIWVISKLLRSTRLAPGNQRVLSMVDSLPLGAKRHVWVVGFRDRTLILGGGGEEVRLLAEYSDDEWAEQAQDIESDAGSALVSEALPPQKTQPEVAAATAPELSRTAPSRNGHEAPLPAIEEPAVTFELSAQAKAKAQAAGAKRAKAKPKTHAAQTTQKSKKRLPPGAHRVPAAFRHLLEEPREMDESAS